MSYNILAMLSLSVTLAVSGCAGLDNHATGARPDWIDATSSRYPREQYIIGRGQADGWYQEGFKISPIFTGNQPHKYSSISI